MKKVERVAVLGAGIQGCSAALAFRESGLMIDLFDKAPTAVSRSSRWNEGKLHLGFTFANDRTEKTAKTMIAGSLYFLKGLERLTHRRIPLAAVSQPFNYVISKYSLVPKDVLERSYATTADYFLVAQEAFKNYYFGEQSNWAYRKMDKTKHERLYDGSLVEAVFETIERSVDPGVVADQVRAAVSESRHINCFYGVHVDRVEARSSHESFIVIASDGRQHGPYDYIINALWEDRLRIDGQIGIHPTRRWIHRYKLALHVKEVRDRSVPSTTLALGPFGDYVCFNNGSAYLSWYPYCRTAMSTGLSPSLEDDAVSANQKSMVLNETVRRLADYIPGLRNVRIDPSLATVDGGFIFAWGNADIDSLESELHQRSDIGVRSYGRYHSIDTGKYCMAPLYAFDVSRRVGANDRFDVEGTARLLEWIR